ncbi:MAG: deoxyribodipyrimidine photo-lyase [Paludibacter sp.]|nr:deoxyribodipyrimidine photo-lyase [Paludibacter sp.]
MVINIPVVIFWFRRDLRIEDNVGLYNALNSGLKVLPLFIFDRNILNKLDNKSDRRVDFIRQALVALNKELSGFGSGLVVKYGHPLKVIETLIGEYNVKTVYLNRDYEPEAIERDDAIAGFLKIKHIDFKPYKDQVVFESSELLKPDGNPYTVFTPYSKAWKKKLAVTDQLKRYDVRSLSAGFCRIENQLVPELEDIGFRKTDVKFLSPVIDENIIRTYDETRDFPASEQGTTSLSAHLRFGTVSVRELVRIAVNANEVWLNELIWREFFMSILVHFPYVVNGPFKKQYENIKWRNDQQEFRRWCAGKTGFPIVDAGMRQLNETGLMHNRVRMIVASFLTKDLLIDWRWGEAYFAEKLLDYDLAANNGNWQWAAGCGCDAAPYFRIFNPVEQTKRYDPDFIYIRRWVKEVDSFEYLTPVVDHKFARERTLNTFKAALNQSCESN